MGARVRRPQAGRRRLLDGVGGHGPAKRDRPRACGFFLHGTEKNGLMVWLNPWTVLWRRRGSFAVPAPSCLVVLCRRRPSWLRGPESATWRWVALYVTRAILKATCRIWLPRAPAARWQRRSSASGTSETDARDLPDAREPAKDVQQLLPSWKLAVVQAL